MIRENSSLKEYCYTDEVTKGCELGVETRGTARQITGDIQSRGTEIKIEHFQDHVSPNSGVPGSSKKTMVLPPSSPRLF